ncbi:IclR family transcriptional regulator [Microbacterium sp. A94]|uniref:IclR family transcriptional regulator n=1 Tax=Microbacterium sp. A94 TaxID=3450717 RepID=UPI003F4348C8
MRTASWTEAVSVLDRMSAILDAFGELGEGLGVTELARRANLPKSTVSRIAADLVAEGYLDRVDANLYLGLRLFELGQNVEQPRRLRRLAISTMTALRDATGQNVQLAIADGEEIVIIANAHGRETDHPVARIGERLPRASTALGAAFEMFTAHDSARARHDVAPVSEVVHGGHVCLASPVYERASVIAALAVSGGIGDLVPGDAAPFVRRAAVALSKRIAAD